MKITIEFNENGISISDSYLKEIDLSAEEKEFTEIVTNFLIGKIDPSLINLEKRSNSYTTFVYGEYNDFLRFKLTSRTKWFSVRIKPSLAKKYENDSRFSDQTNKKQLHWKVKINSSSDVLNYQDVIIESCLSN